MRRHRISLLELNYRAGNIGFWILWGLMIALAVAVIIMTMHGDQ